MVVLKIIPSISFIVRFLSRCHSRKTKKLFYSLNRLGNLLYKLWPWTTLRSGLPAVDIYGRSRWGKGRGHSQRVMGKEFKEHDRDNSQGTGFHKVAQPPLMGKNFREDTTRSGTVWGTRGLEIYTLLWEGEKERENMSGHYCEFSKYGTLARVHRRVMI